MGFPSAVLWNANAVTGVGIAATGAVQCSAAAAPADRGAGGLCFGVAAAGAGWRN